MPSSSPGPALRSRDFRVALVIGAIGILCDLVALRASVPDLRDDIWEYGVGARHLLAGQGFRTSVIHPPLLGLLRRSDATVPVLIHGPLLSLVLAPLVAAFGEAALLQAGWLAAFFLVLTLLPLYRVARRLAGEDAGTLAAAALPWTPLAWRALNHDAVLVLGALLAALALDALLRERPRPALAGVWFGLCYLARGEALLLLPVQASVAALAHRRAGRRPWGAVAAFTIAFAGVALPWWIHNARATGMPLFSLSSYLLISYWPPYHGLSALLDPWLSPERWRASGPALLSVLPAKALSFLPHAAKLAVLQPGPWSAPLFVLGLFAVARRSGILAFATVGTWGVLTLLMATTLYDARYLALALPLIAVATAAGASAAALALPARARTASRWLLVAVLLWPGLRDEAGHPAAERARLAREGGALDAAFPAGEPMLLLTDVPDFAAWRTGWPAVWVDPAIAPTLVRPTWERSSRWIPQQSHVGGLAIWLPSSRGARRQSWSVPASGPEGPAADAAAGHRFREHAAWTPLGLATPVRAGR